MIYLGQQQFQINAPLQTHWEKTDCSRENCGAFEKGFKLIIDRNQLMADGSNFGQLQYDYVKYKSERQFSETELPDHKTEFLFPPGQQCFQQHFQKRNPEEALYNHLSGNRLRYNPSVRELHDTTLEPNQFTDVMNEQMVRF